MGLKIGHTVEGFFYVTMFFVMEVVEVEWGLEVFWLVLFLNHLKRRSAGL